jgi:hypothetical protein
VGRGIRVSVAGADWEPNLHVQARTGRGTTLAARATAALSRVLVRPATLAGVVSVDLAARTLDGVTVPASVSLLRQALPFGLVGWLASSTGPHRSSSPRRSASGPSATGSDT